MELMPGVWSMKKLCMEAGKCIAFQADKKWFLKKKKITSHRWKQFVMKSV